MVTNKFAIREQKFTHFKVRRQIKLQKLYSGKMESKLPKDTPTSKTCVLIISK